MRQRAGDLQSDIEHVANLHRPCIIYKVAKVRAVDLELLPALGQLLPAIYLSTDLEDNTITTNFATKVMQQRSIVGLVRSTP